MGTLPTHLSGSWIRATCSTCCTCTCIYSNVYCNISPVGDDLGLDVDGIHNDIAPVKRINQDGCTEEDYLFVHTDSHKEFMELLLEKRKKLESDITTKLKSREKSSSEGKGVWCCYGDCSCDDHMVITCSIKLLLLIFINAEFCSYFQKILSCFLFLARSHSMNWIFLAKFWMLIMQIFTVKQSSIDN